MNDDPHARYRHYLDQVFALLSRPGPWQFVQTGPNQVVGGVGGKDQGVTEYARDRDDEQPELRCPVCGQRGCPLDVRRRL